MIYRIVKPKSDLPIDLGCVEYIEDFTPIVQLIRGFASRDVENTVMGYDYTTDDEADWEEVGKKIYNIDVKDFVDYYSKLPHETKIAVGKSIDSVGPVFRHFKFNHMFDDSLSPDEVFGDTFTYEFYEDLYGVFKEDSGQRVASLAEMVVKHVNYFMGIAYQQTINSAVDHLVKNLKELPASITFRMTYDKFYYMFSAEVTG